MSHKSVRLLLEDVAKSLADKMQFGYGRRSEFNLIENKRYPYIWLQPMNSRIRSVNSTKTTTWVGILLFLTVDEADADAEDSERLLDYVYDYVERYFQTLDDWSLRSNDIIGGLTITEYVTSPFYKGDSGIHTGWRVDFSIVVSDGFLYCTPENIEIYAGNL